MRRTRSGHGTISFERRNLRVGVSNLLGSHVFFNIQRLPVFCTSACTATINKLDLNPAINKCQFYAKITSGSPVVISDTKSQLKDGVAKGAVAEDDDSANLMVADLCKAFMSAANASEIASPNGNDSENIDPVDVYARPPITSTTTNAARCITRRTSKHWYYRIDVYISYC
ncbi:hypothetical protein FRC12_016175 [Ceratobasidium sp. 428]|nr:hypothetical protein FRC12_016175 [Ceratobasidium sp. 428]